MYYTILLLLLLYVSRRFLESFRPLCRVCPAVFYGTVYDVLGAVEEMESVFDVYVAFRAEILMFVGIESISGF